MIFLCNVDIHWQKFTISFKLRFKTYLTATKIGYFSQFVIIGDIGGSRQMQINLFIDLWFSVDKWNNNPWATSAPQSFCTTWNLLAEIFYTEFSFSRCLELLIIHKKSNIRLDLKSYSCAATDPVWNLHNPIFYIFVTTKKYRSSAWVGLKTIKNMTFKAKLMRQKDKIT